MNNSPATVTRRLLTKKRMPISIRLAKRPGYDVLQLRITVDGDNGSPFSTLRDGSTLATVGMAWNQQGQRAEGRSHEVRQFNLDVSQVLLEINDVYDAQVARGFVPTAKSVKTEYQTGKTYTGLSFTKEHKYSAIGCYRLYLQELTAGNFPEKTLVRTTLDKWGYGLTYLRSYIEQEPDSLSIGPADELTLFWGKSYHRWLMKVGPMAADSATRYVNRLIEAITYVAESGAIKTNPLANLKLSRAKTKEVYFLEPEHLERFWQLDLPNRAGVACWWMGVIFLTGLDHPDAVRYVKDRARYERVTTSGKKIVIRRAKSDAECHIPMLAKLESLLTFTPEGEPMPDWEINREMYAVATLVGFPHRLTCKVGRKTAGTIFYDEYEDIGAVSRMLGHSSTAITERYYVKTTGHTVDKAMQKRLVAPTVFQPFRRVLVG